MTERDQGRLEKEPFYYPQHQIEAISPLDGRYKKEVSEMEPYASEGALISTRAEVEALHLKSLSNWGVIRELNENETEFLDRYSLGLTNEQLQRVKELESVSDHDVDAVRNMMREEIGQTSMQDVVEYTHFLLTSEDVNNIAYRLMIKRGTEDVIIPTLDEITDYLTDMALDEKDTTMLARTHGQAAVPTTLGKEIINFATRINEQTRKLQDTELTGKLNGAVGNFNAHEYAVPEMDWEGYAEAFVNDLGLEYNRYTTQINPYEDLEEMFQSYQRINGVFTDLDQDMWRYISDYWLAQKVEEGETGSSTMAQKVNPIRFENSEGNLAISTGLFETMSRKLSNSRLQRDLSDSTVIRNAPMAISYSLLAYKNTLRGLKRVYPNYERIENDLSEDWSTLTEGVQSYLKREGVSDAYEKVKKASRGVHIGPEEWSGWIDGLDISDEQKQYLKKLSPDSYIGKASELVEEGVQEIRDSRLN